jgi:hypothetical protein
MDDDQQLYSRAPDLATPADAPPVCTAPPADATPPDAPAAGPAPGSSDNPILAPVDTCDSMHPDKCAEGPPAPSPPNPTWDAAKSVGWDLLGLIPGAPAVQTTYDLLKAGYHSFTGDEAAAHHDVSDATLDALGTLPVPYLGIGLSGAAATWDLLQVSSRDKGYSPDDTPLSGDLFYDHVMPSARLDPKGPRGM